MAGADQRLTYQRVEGGSSASRLIGFGVAALLFSISPNLQSQATRKPASPPPSRVLVHTAIQHDISAPLSVEKATIDEPAQAECEGLACGTSPGSFEDEPDPDQGSTPEPVVPAPPPPLTLPASALAVEQTSQGPRSAALMVESFDGLGSGFVGLNDVDFRNPSDNSLAVGPDHIVQIVNSRIAIYSKKGTKYSATGTVLYGAMPTRSVWAGFGGVCEARNNGDAVVRYDQLAERWLIVMPIFSRIDPSEFPERDGLAGGEPVPPAS